jgi:hypothetical protein
MVRNADGYAFVAPATPAEDEATARCARLDGARVLSEIGAPGATLRCQPDHPLAMRIGRLTLSRRYSPGDWPNSRLNAFDSEVSLS